MTGTEDLKLLLEASETLLERCYVACNGFPEGSRCKAFVDTYVEAASRIQKKFPDHPMKVNIEKSDRLASEVLWREAPQMEKEAEPLFFLVQDMALFQQRTVQFLLHVDQAILQHVDHAAHLSMDYTPELLMGYMTLFCNAVRLQLLASSMPKMLIIQLYTLVVNLCQIRQQEPPEEPPMRQQLINYVQAYQEPYARLEVDFRCISHRISQVLESTAYPAITTMAKLQSLQASHILDVQAITQVEKGLPEYIERMRPQWASLVMLPQLREWAIFGFLVCPEEAATLSGLQAMRVLLEETMRIRLYRDVFEWVHPIFQLHVRPTLHQAKHIAQEDRKAYLKAAKNIIADCHESATARCMEAHKQRRTFAASVLSDIATNFGSRPENLTHFRELAVSCLVYAREEILWYFVHLNEDPPMSAIKSMLTVPRTLKEDGCCPSVSLLLKSMMQVYTFCLKYRTAIQAEVLSEISTANERLIRPCITDLKAIERDAPNAEMLQLIAELTEMSNKIEEFPAPDGQGASEFLGKVRSEWERLALSLVSNAQMITVEDLEKATGKVGFLQAFAMIMQQSTFVQSFQTYLDECCCLERLCIHAPKIEKALADSLTAPDDLHSENITGWLFALANLNTPLAQSGVHAASTPRTADVGSLRLCPEELADQWVEEVTRRMIHLILDLNKGAAKDLHDRLDMGEIVRLHEVSMQDKNTLFGVVHATTPSGTGPSGISTKEDEKEKFAREEGVKRDFQAAVAFASGLKSQEVIRVTSKLAICPLSVLQDAVRKCVVRSLEEACFPGKDMQPPVVMAQSFERLLSLVQRLGHAVGISLSQHVREATLSSLMADDNPAHPSLAGRISSWLVDTLLADSAANPIFMAPARSRFLSTGKGIKAEVFSSPAALDALLQTFGGHLVVRLVQAAEGPLRQAMAVVENLLSSHAAMLQSLGTHFKASEGTHQLWEATRVAASNIADMSSLVDALQTAAKIVFFRQLLAEALQRVYAKILPATASNAKLGDSPTPSSSVLFQHFGLHSPSQGQKQTADPSLAAILKEGANLQRLALWNEWPVLAALSLQSNAWGVATYAPPYGNITGRLAGLQVCVPTFIRAFHQACQEVKQECDSEELLFSVYERGAGLSLANPRAAIGVKSLAIAQACKDRHTGLRPGSCLTEALLRSTSQLSCSAAAQTAKRVHPVHSLETLQN